MTDIATALIGGRKIEVRFIGIRPGEKIHESLISREESTRAVPRGNYYAIQPMLPELTSDFDEAMTLSKEYSSGDEVMNLQETTELLRSRSLMLESAVEETAEMLR